MRPVVQDLRRAVVVQRRRIQEHAAGDCPLGGIGNPCPGIAYERGILTGLLRALRKLGEDVPWGVTP